MPGRWRSERRLMIEELVRPHLRDFKPYISARSEALEAKIFLDANELTSGSPISFDGPPLNRYPDPNQWELRERLAEMTGVAIDSVFVGVGSDEIIDLLIRLVCEPHRDSIAILEPTYGVYRVTADLNGVEVLAVELDDRFQIDVERTLRAVRATTKLIFCCSPNNPTGNLLDREQIMDLCRSFRGAVVADEAYVEFSGSASLARDVQTIENLVVLRTFSKAWGLAGIRLGYTIANPYIVSYLLRIKSPYNISSTTSALALKALETGGFVGKEARRVIAERENLANQLGDLQIVEQVYPSRANFLLVRFTDSERAYSSLLKNGIVVRRRSEPLFRNCLRITVGTSEENRLLINTLSEL
jgi:histidinol-phosphate aminotransferase